MLCFDLLVGPQGTAGPVLGWGIGFFLLGLGFSRLGVPWVVFDICVLGFGIGAENRKNTACFERRLTPHGFMSKTR